ncbi:MAG TPA: hypothetical protein DCX77_03400 [Acidimicrobiaceae bacterium]|nr:hypothetical protein [Acidimicrobiaceae bacterium]HAX04699.1 hypothetical protein [Acidimicrobiaceae bacterium]
MLSSQVPPEETVGLAQLVEETGFKRLWLTEDYYRKAGFASCGAVLGATSELSVGLGVASIYMRHPTVLAMEIATLHRMFRGRFEVGLGLGSPRALKSSKRMPESKIDSVRGRVELIAKLVAGEQVSWGDFVDTVGDARLQYPDDSNAKMWLGAEGPQMLALAGECADGVVLSAFSTPLYLEWAMGVLHVSDPCPSTLYLHTSVHEETKFAAETAASILMARIQAGYVSSSMRRSGYWDVVRPLLGASSDVIKPYLTEEMVSAFVVFGTPDECRQKLQVFENTGVDEIALVPNMGNDPARLGEAVSELSDALEV